MIWSHDVSSLLSMEQRGYIKGTSNMEVYGKRQVQEGEDDDYGVHPSMAFRVNIY